ncbi:hypothetical protein Q4577_09750 [Marinovum sp. 2_MG-2023]|uniref:hypothetical protein n=1 Tax=Roseobacteraceae TaxID=2854170 RepID=UPI001FD090FA|nr:MULTISPECIES: hypothetical protein [Roseobacteraceae]MCJ7872617.1 hypothetical protein [Phaeobacter sp. J2-8]MDO6730303.1 hypothetical protein [Marinovum sp. 2_MG-2023]MDO6779041.1 hypothetical protein [Marinovum sp. 1_MG-2023]
MSELTLTKTRFFEGVWEGVLRDRAPGAGDPSIKVMYGDRALDGIKLSKEGETGTWQVRFRIPPALLSEGSHTIVFTDAGNGDVLESFSLMAGEALGDDIRTEVDLLRAELDLLKRAFRSHCREAG